jgi:hypothetical protein
VDSNTGQQELNRRRSRRREPDISRSGLRAIEVVMSTTDTSTWERLEGAALSLVRSGPIKERLIDAYRNHLAFVNLEELPEGLRGQFRACHEALTREAPLRGEDAVRATVRKLSNSEADELALSVVRLFAASAREAALHDGALDGPLTEGARINGNGALRALTPKSPPQVISLYAAEA